MLFNIRYPSGCRTGKLSATPFSLRPDQGNLLATGGVSRIEGAGGARLAPWAMISG